MFSFRSIPEERQSSSGAHRVRSGGGRRGGREGGRRRERGMREGEKEREHERDGG